MTDNKKGRGWHGDSEGHARAGSQSSGKFEEGSRAQESGQKGGEARREQNADFTDMGSQDDSNQNNQ